MTSVSQATASSVSMSPDVGGIDGVDSGIVSAKTACAGSAAEGLRHAKRPKNKMVWRGGFSFNIWD
jgi:hypothetical protein